MRHALHTAEIVAASLLLLTFAALPAHGQSLGEVTAATGVHGTLARGGGSSSTGALKSVKSSLSKSTKSRDFGAGMGFGGGGKSSGSKSRASRPSGSRSSGGGGRGSWVSGSEVSRGSNSSAWAQGGSGWGTSGGGGRRAPARRPRS